MQSSSNHDIVSNQLSFDDDCEMIPINHGGTSSSNKSLCHDHRPRYEIYTILILSISLLLALSKISQQRADIKYLIDETGKLNKFSVEVNENPSTFDEAQLKSDTTMKPKKYSIIPEKIYTVIGLESSGTQFMSSILTKALGLEHYREGSFPCNRNCDEYATVQVQHTKDEIGYDEEMNDIDEFNDDDQWRRSLGALPTKNNVVVVSYEALLKLKGTYLKTVYSALDIQSDYIPSFKDGNSKYINGRRANSSNK